MKRPRLVGQFTEGKGQAHSRKELPVEIMSMRIIGMVSHPHVKKVPRWIMEAHEI
jgi:hypothetical protein